MLNYFQAIVLGIIQGVTEWLPISSQAMVFLFGRLFFDLGHIDALGVSIWLHSGTLLAAVVYFWKDILRILTSDKKMLKFLILATMMSGLVAAPFLLILLKIELPMAIFTIIIGALLLTISFLQKRSRELKIGEKSLILLGPRDGLIVGAIQGLAVLPGLSRSGLTIATFLAQKYSLKNAFYLSFLMSIPIIFLAQIALPIFEREFVVSPTLLVGALTSGLVGFATIRALLQFAQRVNFFKATLILGIMVVFVGVVLLFFNI